MKAGRGRDVANSRGDHGPRREGHDFAAQQHVAAPVVGGVVPVGPPEDPGFGNACDRVRVCVAVPSTGGLVVGDGQDDPQPYLGAVLSVPDYQQIACRSVDDLGIGQAAAPRA